MRFSRRSIFGLLVMAIISAVLVAAPVMAAEQRLNAEIISATVTQDRNGSEYTRFIVQVDKKIQGIEYSVGVPAMAFGPLNEQAKALKAGDTLKCIASSREFQGRSSYTIIKFID